MPTFYVTKAGNDTTGDGSVGNPYLTMAKAETVASDGDTINVGAGTYEASHTLAKQIAYVGAGIGLTILRANNASRCIYLNSTKVKSLTGFTIDGLSSGSTPASLVEGAVGNLNTTFISCAFTHGKTSTIRYNSGSYGITLQDCTIDAYTETQIIYCLGGASGFTLDNVTINVPLGLTMNAVIYNPNAVTSGTFSITDCNITVLSNYAPIRMIGGGWVSPVISRNTITVGTNSTRAEIELKDIVTSCEITDNTIIIPSTSTATTPIQCRSTVGTGPDCIYTIERNLIETHNKDSYGTIIGDEGGDINSKAGAFNGSSVSFNTYHFPPYFGEPIGAAHCMMFGGNTNIFCEGNIVVGAAYGAACKGHSEAWTDGYIKNNIFINCTYSVRMKGQSNIRCANNVIYNTNAQVGTSLSVTENGVGEDSDNAFLRNNLCIRDADKVYEFLDTSYATCDTDYNGVYLTGTATMGTKFPAVSYDTLAAWQAGTGKDLNSVSGNPNIKADYTIDKSSIMFEKGIPIKGVTEAYDTTEANIITLAGNATYSMDVPYRKRVLVS